MLPTYNESFMKSVQSIDIWDLYLYCIPLHAIMSPMYFLIGFYQKIQQLFLTESKSVTWTKLKEGKPVTWTKLKEGKPVTWSKLNIPYLKGFTYLLLLFVQTSVLTYSKYTKRPEQNTSLFLHEAYIQSSWS